MLLGHTYRVSGDVARAHRRATDLVDKILKGQKPADNSSRAANEVRGSSSIIKTAKTLGLDMPPMLVECLMSNK